MEMLKKIQGKGNLFFVGEPGFRFGETPDVVILFDRQARDYQKGNGNFELIYPTEGTVAFPYALVSRRPLSYTKTVLKNHFEKAGYHTNVNDIPRSKKMDGDIYAALIRSESKINRNLQHVFRPFRTNIFENSITYVLSLMLLSIMGLYFYFRISDPVLRKYISYIFILMIFWSILRLVRLLLPDEDTMHRYAWYFYYVALIYIPLLFMWIAVEVDGRWSAVVRSRIKRIGFVVATVLVFLVLTNDLHQWVFQSTDEWGTYRFNRLIIVILIYYGFSTLFSLILLVRKAFAMPRRKQLLFPTLVVFGLAVYSAIFLLFLNNRISTEFTRTVILFVLIIITSSVRFGLLPFNTKHKILFQNANLALEIRDHGNRPVLVSGSKPDTGVYIRKIQPIRGGYVVWNEDRSYLHQLFKEEDLLNEKLEENYQILQRRYQIEHDLQTVTARMRLQEQIENLLKNDLVALEKQIQKAGGKGDKAQRQALTIASLELLRLKHRSNFLMEYLIKGLIQVDNVMLSLHGIKKAVRSMGLHCTYSAKVDGQLSFKEADRILGWVVSAMTYALKEGEELSFAFTTRPDVFIIHLYAEKGSAFFPGFIHTMNVSGLAEAEEKIHALKNEDFHIAILEVKLVKT